MSSAGSVPSWHKVTGFFGAVLLLAGVVLVFQSQVAIHTPITEMFIGPIAFLALAFGMWRVRARYTGELNHVEIPDAELPFALPTPGDELDEMVYRYTRRGEATLEYPQRIGERLREVAIAVVAHREGITREHAIEKLDDGSWTDNQYAQAYFSEQIGVPEQDSQTELLRRFGRGESAYERQIRETVDAIVDIAELVETPTEELDVEQDLMSLLLGSSDEDEDDTPQAVERSEKSVHDYVSEDGDRVADHVSYHETNWTGRWTAIGAFALFAAAVGVAAVQPGLVLGGSVAVAYAAFAHSGTNPDLTGLTVEREIEDEKPAPGDELEVTVTVENQGESFLPDVRIVDLVPANMRVINGSPRIYTSMQSGAKVTFTYTLVAERGDHEWPLLAVGSGFSGSVEREAVIDVGTSISAVPRLSTVAEVSVRDQTTVYSGQVSTDTGGPGLEFFSVREYRPNDPMRRVDWNRRARTGELATINFREEEAATVTLLFDARESAYVSSAPGERHALDRAVDAASEVYAALSDKGDLVGVAAFDTVPCWLGPSAGDGHDEATRQLFAHHPALASLPPDMLDLEGGYVDPMTHVRRQLPVGTQVMLFSPLNSDYPAEVARRLDSSGHRVTIVSPDPTNDASPGQRLARVERATRINGLRERGIRIVDWGEDEPLNLSFERATRRWQA
ncbi:MAG: DUF58 domain-containing protein [Halobacteriaceae archaeon]